MKKCTTKKTLGRLRRKTRVRKKITGTSDKPRLNVFRSAKNISVQLIDDTAGSTLVSASTTEKLFNDAKGKGSVVGAKLIGEEIAKRASTKGVKDVVFDRSGYRYHGRVKALAEAAREKGLRF